MNRLQKKCFVFSIGLHGLLLVIFLLGAGFLSHRPKNEAVPVLDFIPSKIVEGLVSGGGTAGAKPPPPAPAPAPKIETPPPTPQPVVKKADIPKPEPPKVAPRTPEPVTPPSTEVVKVPPKRWETKPAKPEIQPNLKPTVRSKSSVEQARKAQNEAAERQRAEAAHQASIKSAVESLRNTFSTSTGIEVPGPGGEAYAGYSLVIQSIYQNAWIKPSGVVEAVNVVKVTVVIDKAGNVTSAKIVKGSGNPAVDASVQRTLDRIRKVPPFPEGSKDDQRIFDIDFNLTAKSLLG